MRISLVTQHAWHLFNHDVKTSFRQWVELISQVRKSPMYQLSIVMLRSKSKLRTQYPLPPIFRWNRSRSFIFKLKRRNLMIRVCIFSSVSFHKKKWYFRSVISTCITPDYGCYLGKAAVEPHYWNSKKNLITGATWNWRSITQEMETWITHFTYLPSSFTDLPTATKIPTGSIGCPGQFNNC